uniref:Uncharacterized protein n=1 Tax=Arundo donax TaxID=35708 RepID=A0A0A9GSH5_ARUDO
MQKKQNANKIGREKLAQKNLSNLRTHKASTRTITSSSVLQFNYLRKVSAVTVYVFFSDSHSIIP